MAEYATEQATRTILSVLESDYPETLKADGFDDAIIGVAEGWFGQSNHCVICYDYEKCAEILVEQGMSEEDAEEYLQFNTTSAYVGEYTPVFLHRWR